LIKFVDPKKTLLEMVQKFGREKPVSRYASAPPLPSPLSFVIFQASQRDRSLLQLSRVRRRHLLRR
jgi:hypothetical protein